MLYSSELRNSRACDVPKDLSHRDFVTDGLRMDDRDLSRAAWPYHRRAAIPFERLGSKQQIATFQGSVKLCAVSLFSVHPKNADGAILLVHLRG